MAFAGDELQAAEFHFARHESTAKRVIRLANYGDLAAFLSANFPTPNLYYPVEDARFPNANLNWLYIDTIDVKQMSDKLDSASPPNPVSGWECTLNYKSKPYINNQPNQNDLPGNKPGSQGGTMISYDVDIGGNFLTLPNSALMWASDSSAIFNKDIQFGVVAVTIEHTVTWHNMLIPPWGAIRRCAGNVNSTVMLGASIGNLMFVGVNGSREFSVQGSPTWTLKYKFSEKQTSSLVATLPAVAGLGGWNLYLRPDKSPVVYDAIIYRGQSGTAAASYTYQYVDMTNLFLPGGT
jgi:hypothetical protein